MLGSLTLILLCQLIGEIVTKVTGMPVPGPVLGMVILFCILLISGDRLPEGVNGTGGFLLRYLALLFVPVGVGIVTHLDLLARFWAPIAGVIILGTLVTVAVTGAVMQWCNRRCRTAPKEGPQ